MSKVTGVPTQAGAEADVVQPAVVAEGDRSVVVDPVGPDPVVGTDDRPGRDGFRSGRVGLGGGAAAAARGAAGRCCSRRRTGSAGVAAR